MLNSAEFNYGLGMSTTPTPAAPLPTTVAVNGDAIRARRVELGDNLREFADRVGLSLQYVSQLERGDRGRVTPATFRRLVVGLDMVDRDAELKAAA